MKPVTATRLLALQLKLRVTSSELTSIQNENVKKCAEDIISVANELRNLARTPPA